MLGSAVGSAVGFVLDSPWGTDMGRFVLGHRDAIDGDDLLTQMIGLGIELTEHTTMGRSSGMRGHTMLARIKTNPAPDYYHRRFPMTDASGFQVQTLTYDLHRPVDL